MHKLWSMLFFTVCIFAQSTEYRPTTIITNYDVNISITSSGELDIVEKLEIRPRILFDGRIYNPVLSLNIPTMLQSKNAIRGINQEIGNFFITLNDKPVMWQKDIFYKNSPDELLRIRLQTDYIMSLLSEAELKEVTKRSRPKKYIYTIKYKVKRTVYESLEKGFDEIGWKIFKNRHVAIKNATINLFFPTNLTKEEFHTFDFHYTASTDKKQIYEWKSKQHFYSKINNFRENDLLFNVSFPRNTLSQSSSRNFNLVLGDQNDDEITKPIKAGYEWDQFLLYWQFPFFIVYFILLYYYARSYGSFGALGSIVVRYGPPDNMSLLQSGLLLDKSADIEDFPAAIVELAAMGHLKIVNEGDKNLTYLKRISKKTDELTYDQRYLLNKVLFAKQDTYHFPFNNNSDLYSKFHQLNEKLYAWLERHQYIYENFKRTRNVFLLKAFLSSLPILIFSLYVTKDLYGERLMIGSIAGIFFLTVIIVFILMKTNFFEALPFLIGIYIIIGIPFVMKTHSYWVLLSTPMLIMPFIYALMWFFYKKIGIYTGKGLQAYRHLLGYHEFVKRTEAPKLDALLKVHPEHVESALSYAMLFKMIRYPRLPSFKSKLPTNHRLDNSHQNVYYFGKVQIVNEGSGPLFLFSLFGIVLFLLLKAYSMFIH